MEEEEILDFEEETPKKKKKKSILKIFIVLIILLIITLISGIVYFNHLLSSVSNDNNIINFTIEEGSSVYSIGEKLEKEKIIRSVFAYKLYVKLNNINEFKAGIYRISKNLDTKEIIDILSGNKYSEESFNITFKEGNTIRSVVKTISENTNYSESEIYQKLEDKNFIDLLIEKYWFLSSDIKNENIYYPLEGYLFPETYSFNKNAKIEDIITKMLDQTDKVFSEYKTTIESSSYSINELVTLASIVEKEGIHSADRKMIAQVFYNRLKTGMPLGSDVTTYYAFKVDIGSRDLTNSEINTYNLYNTRGPNMAGKLPVGAISNFSKTSFEAVLMPIDNSYYYFVADKNGKTHFTKTYTEHQNIINKLKKEGNWITF